MCVCSCDLKSFKAGVIKTRNFYFFCPLCVGERVRNRDRVLQIRDLHRGNKTSLASLLAADDDDGFDEDENFGK